MDIRKFYKMFGVVIVSFTESDRPEAYSWSVSGINAQFSSKLQIALYLRKSFPNIFPYIYKYHMGNSIIFFIWKPF